MLLGAGGFLVGCEGVTLLPPGSRWLTKALTCVGVDTSAIDNDFESDDILGEKHVSFVCFYFGFGFGLIV